MCTFEFTFFMKRLNIICVLSLVDKILRFVSAPGFAFSARSMAVMWWWKLFTHCN